MLKKNAFYYSALWILEHTMKFVFLFLKQIDKLFPLSGLQQNNLSTSIPYILPTQLKLETMRKSFENDNLEFRHDIKLKEDKMDRILKNMYF